MIKGLLVSLIVILLSATPVAAQEINCKIEDWRSTMVLGNILQIEGVTTCKKGMIHIRLYDGEKFIGLGQGIIEGNTFTTMTQGVSNPANLKIKYSVSASLF